MITRKRRLITAFSLWWMRCSCQDNTVVSPEVSVMVRQQAPGRGHEPWEQRDLGPTPPSPAPWRLPQGDPTFVEVLSHVSIEMSGSPAWVRVQPGFVGHSTRPVPVGVHPSIFATTRDRNSGVEGFNEKF